MKAYVMVLAATLGSASLAVSGLMLLSAGDAVSGVEAVDPIIAGVIPVRPPVMSPNGFHASPPAVFSMSNFTNKAACLVERGATLTSHRRGFFAPPDCEAVWPGLAKVESWTQNEDGSVTLSNGNGAAVLTLVRSKSFSYEVSRPAGADIALLMLP